MVPQVGWGATSGIHDLGEKIGELAVQFDVGGVFEGGPSGGFWDGGTWVPVDDGADTRWQLVMWWRETVGSSWRWCDFDQQQD